MKIFNRAEYIPVENAIGRKITAITHVARSSCDSIYINLDSGYCVEIFSDGDNRLKIARMISHIPLDQKVGKDYVVEHIHE